MVQGQLKWTLPLQVESRGSKATAVRGAERLQSWALFLAKFRFRGMPRYGRTSSLLTISGKGNPPCVPLHV